jgi:uncharacterized membrane protein YdjX (TVP38/TMEM64 family)
MRERIMKLLEVKSIVTLMLTGASTYGFIVGTVPVELYASWVGGIIAYFFARQTEK